MLGLCTLQTQSRTTTCLPKTHIKPQPDVLYDFKHLNLSKNIITYITLLTSNFASLTAAIVFNYTTLVNTATQITSKTTRVSVFRTAKYRTSKREGGGIGVVGEQRLSVRMQTLRLATSFVQLFPTSTVLNHYE
jgi:hypothetical protein